MLGLGTGEGRSKPLCFPFARSAAVYKEEKKKSESYLLFLLLLEQKFAFLHSGSWTAAVVLL